MSEVGVERLGACEGEEHGAERDEGAPAVRSEETNRVGRVERCHDDRSVTNRERAGNGDRHEPQHHDRSEEFADAGRAAVLQHEQRDENRDSGGDHVMLERSCRNGHALDGAED